MEKKDDLNNILPGPKESDSDTNNAVVPSDDNSIGCFSGQNEIDPSSNKSDNKNLLLNEILEFGFEKEKIELAMKMSNDKQQIIDLIMKMEEDADFYNQIKENAKTASMINSHPVIKFDHSSEYKMVIVVRKDLGMGVGKVAAQVGHAVLGCYKLSCLKKMMNVHIWENCATPKIVLGCENEKELLELKAKADENGVINFLVADAGRTQIAPGSITCCAFGPDICNNIDNITGKLKLL